MRSFLFLLLSYHISFAQITLDSSIIFLNSGEQNPTRKISYQYSTDGALKKELVFMLDSSNQYLTRFYENVAKQDTVERYDSIKTQTGWDFAGLKVNTYDSEMKLLTETEYDIDNNASFTLNNTYGDNGNLIERFKGYTYDDSLDIWRIGTKYLWTYDEYNTPSSLEVLSWNKDSMNYEPSSKSFWIYENEKNSYTFERLVWRNDEQKYDQIENKRIEYIKDINGNITRLEIYEDGLNYRYFEFEYYDNGAIKSEKYYAWSTKDLEWIPQLWTEYEILNHIDLTEISTPDYIPETLKSAGLQNHSYINDPFTFINPITSNITYTYTNNEWVFVSEVKFYYSQPTGVISFNTKKNNFYPNPAKNELFFFEGINSVTIQDLTGVVRLKVNSTTNKIDISNLYNGSYILLLETETGLVSEKLIISK